MNVLLFNLGDEVVFRRNQHLVPMLIGRITKTETNPKKKPYEITITEVFLEGTGLKPGDVISAHNYQIYKYEFKTPVKIL